MDMCEANLSLRLPNGEQAAIAATRVRFSAHQCFSGANLTAEANLLVQLGKFLANQRDLAVCGSVDFWNRITRLVPELAGLVLSNPTTLPSSTRTVFLAETLSYPRQLLGKLLPKELEIIEPDIVQEIAFSDIPASAWVPASRETIYPIEIPEFHIETGLDLVLMDCPARNLAMMPNGLAYVHNALKRSSVHFQTIDADILIYHRYHLHRLFDQPGEITLSNGDKLPADPWLTEHIDLWKSPAVLEHFYPIIDEIVAQLVAAKPKVLGLSIQECNEYFCRELVNRLKSAAPEIIILAGGFSCINPDVGFRAFPEAEYMCIGEADLTVVPLVERIANGEIVRNMPGVLSRHDVSAFPFIPAPVPHNLDLIDWPRYEWNRLDLYQNHNGYQLTPVVASRGCKWARCTFCAERFFWRIRSPKVFVDELEWLRDRGFYFFMFNESDLNGRPEILLEICDEVIRRKMKVRFTGQLRINKKSNRAFFDKLKQAGFTSLRFGVDAFSDHTMLLQKKGYTSKTVEQNLRDCTEAGIRTEVNWVIGVPGETEQDIDEGIDLFIRNKPWIWRLANINPLILVNGGLYWIEPEKYNVHFRQDRETLKRNHPRAIPAQFWYSTEPYIDEHVRKDRLERIVVSLHDAGIMIGPWADKIINDVRYARDANRGSARAADVGDSQKQKAENQREFVPAFATIPDSSVSNRSGACNDETYLLRTPNEIYRIDSSAASRSWDVDGFQKDVRTRLLDGANIDLAITRGAQTRLITWVGDYNLIKYDGSFFGVPIAMGRPDWERLDVGALPGVTRHATLAESLTVLHEMHASACVADEGADNSALLLESAHPMTISC